MVNISLPQKTWVILCHNNRQNKTVSSACVSSCLLSWYYLQIKHPYEVGALRIVFDEANHPSVLQAPCERTVRQSHKELSHGGGHRLRTHRRHTSSQFFLHFRVCSAVMLQVWQPLKCEAAFSVSAAQNDGWRLTLTPEEETAQPPFPVTATSFFDDLMSAHSCSTAFASTSCQRRCASNGTLKTQDHKQIESSFMRSN